MQLGDSPTLVFNELSLKGVGGEAIRGALPGLAKLIIEARENWVGLRMASPAGVLGSLQPDDMTETLATLGLKTGGEARDAWRYVATSADRLSVELEHDPVIEYRVNGLESLGLGVAANTGHVGLSLHSEDTWSRLEIVLQKTSLLDNGEILVQEIEALNVAHREDLNSHQGYIDMIRDRTPFQDFLANYCPRISLITRVWDSIPELERSGGVMRQIRDRLLELNLATEGWDPKASKEPAYRSHVTPESDSRKSLCKFRDDAGVFRLYELHARYTPTEGRIHFRFIFESGVPRMEIGHIGPKLL